MKKFLAILFVLLLATSVAFAGTVEKMVGTPNRVSIVAAPSETKINITNPEFLAKYSARQGAANNKFEVVYRVAGTKDSDGTTYVEVPAEAKAAVDYALAIWADNIQTSVPIVVRIGMASLESNILGGNWNEGYFRNFPNAPQAGIFYASSLANALAGSRVGNNTFPPTPPIDTNIAMNVNFSWYYGIDGKCPNDKYDFVTIMLHEITHGLSFLGFANYSFGQGDYSLGVSTYDTFIVDQSGKSLTTYSVGTALGSALTSDALYFAGPNAKAANKGNVVQIHAPTTWSDGSSYSHVGESFRSDGSGNKLMLFSASKGGVIHTPGDVVMGMLKDMGWNRGDTPTPTPSSSGGGCNAAPGLMFAGLLAVPAGAFFLRRGRVKR